MKIEISENEHSNRLFAACVLAAVAAVALLIIAVTGYNAYSLYLVHHPAAVQKAEVPK